MWGGVRSPVSILRTGEGSTFLHHPYILRNLLSHRFLICSGILCFMEDESLWLMVGLGRRLSGCVNH